MTISHNAGVTAARGFSAAGIAAGVKKNGAKDMALVVNTENNLTAAGVFTRNKFQAAPVLWSRKIMRNHTVRAVVLNSGGANACTGKEGLADTEDSANELAQALTAQGFPTMKDQVAVCSTGVIGDRLPMDAIVRGIRELPTQLGDQASDGKAAASAIMTTDKVVKCSELISKNGWTIGGMVKGAGMIAPSLATMLCVITTDAVANSDDLQKALNYAASHTFDRLDVDGSTSTNDTVIVMANGASGVSVDVGELQDALLRICDDLADQMMSDAEGVTKCCLITVNGAASEEDALIAARVVARDNLVKTALFGEDPNWGRVLATLGVAPVDMDVDKVIVAFNNKQVFAQGRGLPDARTIDMQGSRINVNIHLGVGTSSATIRTTDLSHEYVDINSAYTT